MAPRRRRGILDRARRSTEVPSDERECTDTDDTPATGPPILTKRPNHVWNLAPADSDHGGQPRDPERAWTSTTRRWCRRREKSRPLEAVVPTIGQAMPGQNPCCPGSARAGKRDCRIGDHGYPHAPHKTPKTPAARIVGAPQTPKPGHAYRPSTGNIARMNALRRGACSGRRALAKPVRVDMSPSYRSSRSTTPATC